MKIIRGAICAENTVESISRSSLELIETILRRNALKPNDVECVFFSATADIDACYPATAVRTQLLPDAVFMCLSEMSVSGSMEKVIRVAVFVSVEISSPKHCYLGKAAALRPDIF